MKRVIIMGSPRSNGRSSHLAEMLFEANIDERPDDELFLVPVSEVEVGPCIGCGGCREKMPVILRGADGEEVTEERNRCVFDDDMQTVYDLLDDADALTIVSPVYFSGAPSLMKAVLDRLQPYFWATGGHVPAAEKRPAELHVVGEGGDPHGYDPLVNEVKSALAVAGFRLERIFDWVGKIDGDGTITAEAEVRDLAGSPVGNAREAATDRPSGAERPRLDLSSGSKSGSAKKQGSGQKRPANERRNAGRKHQQGGGKQGGKGRHRG